MTSQHNQAMMYNVGMVKALGGKKIQILIFIKIEYMKNKYISFPGKKIAFMSATDHESLQNKDIYR